MDEIIRIPGRDSERGVALTAALEGEYAESGSPMREVAILLRCAGIDVVGQRLGIRALR